MNPTNFTGYSWHLYIGVNHSILMISYLSEFTTLYISVNFIYHNIQYAEINTKPDVCFKCDYTGEIKLDDNLEWYCPNCGNRDKEEMQVMRRTCGYIGSNMWGKGRTQEIGQRVLHL